MTSLVFQALLIAALFLVFYVALVRPQQIKLRRYQELLNTLGAGDRVSTHGGLVGTVVGINGDDTLTLEIAPEVHVTVTRKGVSERWPAAHPKPLQKSREDRPSFA